jgi:hypothetical protein
MFFAQGHSPLTTDLHCFDARNSFYGSMRILSTFITHFVMWVGKLLSLFVLNGLELNYPPTQEKQ